MGVQALIIGVDVKNLDHCFCLIENASMYTYRSNTDIFPFPMFQIPNDEKKKN